MTTLFIRNGHTLYISFEATKRMLMRTTNGITAKKNIIIHIKLSYALIEVQSMEFNEVYMRIMDPRMPTGNERKIEIGFHFAFIYWFYSNTYTCI